MYNYPSSPRAGRKAIPPSKAGRRGVRSENYPSHRAQQAFVCSHCTSGKHSGCKSINCVCSKCWS